MRALVGTLGLGLGLAAAACGPELGPAQPWRDAAAIEGALRPELALDRYPAPPAPARLRVVTFNVHFGADVDGLADALLASGDAGGADLLLLQEIEAHPDEGGSRAARLAARLAMNHVYAPGRVEGAGTHGVAVLSRFPLLDAQVMELARADIGFHTRRRVALAVDVLIGDGVLRVVDVHLDLRIGVADRLRQLRPVVIDQPTPVVVGGDLNTIPWAWIEGVVPSVPAQAAVDADAARAVDAMMAGLGFTAPTAALGPTDNLAELPLADQRLDSIYPRGLTPTAAAIVGDVDTSDHLPVRVDLAWPPP